jgi:hypothetical protein
MTQRFLTRIITRCSSSSSGSSPLDFILILFFLGIIIQQRDKHGIIRAITRQKKDTTNHPSSLCMALLQKRTCFDAQPTKRPSYIDGFEVVDCEYTTNIDAKQHWKISFFLAKELCPFCTSTRFRNISPNTSFTHQYIAPKTIVIE